MSNIILYTKFGEKYIYEKRFGIGNSGNWEIGESRIQGIGDFGNLEIRNSGIQGFRESTNQGFADSGTQGFGDSGKWRIRDLGIWELRDSGINAAVCSFWKRQRTIISSTNKVSLTFIVIIAVSLIESTRFFIGTAFSIIAFIIMCTITNFT